MKKLLIIALLALASCERDADVASRNLSTDAANFKIARRIVFYNGITDKYILEIQGLCAVEENGKRLSVTCKVDNKFKKHMLGTSDNVTWFAEQLDAANVSTQLYRVIFKPSTIIPDIELR